MAGPSMTRHGIFHGTHDEVISGDHKLTASHWSCCTEPIVTGADVLLFRVLLERVTGPGSFFISRHLWAFVTMFWIFFLIALALHCMLILQLCCLCIADWRVQQSFNFFPLGPALWMCNSYTLRAATSEKSFSVSQKGLTEAASVCTASSAYFRPLSGFLLKLYRFYQTFISFQGVLITNKRTAVNGSWIGDHKGALQAPLAHSFPGISFCPLLSRHSL